MGTQGKQSETMMQTIGRKGFGRSWWAAGLAAAIGLAADPATSVSLAFQVTGSEGVAEQAVEELPGLGEEDSLQLSPANDPVDKVDASTEAAAPKPANPAGATEPSAPPATQAEPARGPAAPPDNASAAQANSADAASPPTAPPPSAERELGAARDSGGREARNAAADNSNTEYQVLDQGPIHEAFAQPLTQENAKTLTVAKAPPTLIEELPPEVKPEGDNVQWIPGYWQWSDEVENFVWVSGLWRNVPPGRQWVPGYWNEIDGQYEWVAGFWSDGQQTEVRYLPNPPESLEQGPVSPAPGDNYFWIPGCWMYRSTSYVWRPGYWHIGQNNWVWVPSHYRLTPAGAIFVMGYWDYLPQYRGLLYAPVYWAQPNYLAAGYFYRPRSVIDTSLLLSVLYVHRDYGRYYYGYGNWRYGNYVPWYAAWNNPRWYDPFCAYQSWHSGRRDWYRSYESTFVSYQERYQQLGRNHIGRPGYPGGGHGGWDRFDYLQSIDQVNRVGQRDLQRFRGGELDDLRRSSDDWREFQQQRRQHENRLSTEKRVPVGGSMARDRVNPEFGVAGVPGNRNNTAGGNSNRDRDRNRTRDLNGRQVPVDGTPGLANNSSSSSLRLPENLRVTPANRNNRPAGESGMASGNLSRQRRLENSANADAPRDRAGEIERNLNRWPGGTDPRVRINRDLVTEPDNLSERARQRVDQWNRTQMEEALNRQRLRSLGSPNELEQNRRVPAGLGETINRVPGGVNVDRYQPNLPGTNVPGANGKPRGLTERERAESALRYRPPTNFNRDLPPEFRAGGSNSVEETRRQSQGTNRLNASPLNPGFFPETGSTPLRYRAEGAARRQATEESRARRVPVGGTQGPGYRALRESGGATDGMRNGGAQQFENRGGGRGRGAGRRNSD